jgi:hypothetical protein
VIVAGLRPRGVACGAFAVAPLLGTGAVGMLAYPADGAMVAHGLAWPPRFVMTWTVFVAACLFSAAFAERPSRDSRKARRLWCAAAVLLSMVAQHAALVARRDYDGVGRLATVAFRRSTLASGALTLQEEHALLCLGARLPVSTPVKAPQFLDGRFHRQTPLADWPESQIVVCDTAARQRWLLPAACERSRIATATNSVQVGELWIAFAPALKPIVEACASGR